MGLRNPKIETITKIANAMHVSVSELTDSDTSERELGDTCDTFYEMYIVAVQERMFYLEHIINILEHLNENGMEYLLNYANTLTKNEDLISARTFDNIIYLTGEPVGRCSSHLTERGLVPMITYSELFTFVIMLCAVITLVVNLTRKK